VVASISVLEFGDLQRRQKFQLFNAILAQGAYLHRQNLESNLILGRRYYAGSCVSAISDVLSPLLALFTRPFDEALSAGGEAISTPTFPLLVLPLLLLPPRLALSSLLPFFSVSFPCFFATTTAAFFVTCDLLAACALSSLSCCFIITHSMVPMRAHNRK
jgi:hypothetical protein